MTAPATDRDPMAEALRQAVEHSPANKVPRWVEAILTASDAPVGQTPITRPA